MIYTIPDNSPEQGSDTKLNGGSAALSQRDPGKEGHAHRSSLPGFISRRMHSRRDTLAYRAGLVSRLVGERARGARLKSVFAPANPRQKRSRSSSRLRRELCEAKIPLPRLRLKTGPPREPSEAVLVGRRGAAERARAGREDGPRLSTARDDDAPAARTLRDEKGRTASPSVGKARRSFLLQADLQRPSSDLGLTASATFPSEGEGKAL